MIVGEMVVSEMIVGQMIFGEMRETQYEWLSTQQITSCKHAFDAWPIIIIYSGITEKPPILLQTLGSQWMEVSLLPYNVMKLFCLLAKIIIRPIYTDAIN